MSDNPDNLNLQIPGDIDGLTSSLSKAVNPEIVNSIINAMDNATPKMFDPETIKNLSGNMDDSLSKAINPEIWKAMNSTMDETFPKSVNIEMLKSLGVTVDDSLSKVIDPEMTKAMSSTTDDFLPKYIDPKIFESMRSLPISDFSRQIMSEFYIPISKSYAQLTYEEQQDYNGKSLKFLEEIRNNTATLATLIDLIAENNENQEILLQILSQMLEIATAKNQEELNGKFERLLERIKNTLELGELSGKLLFYAYTIFSLVAPHIGK